MKKHLLAACILTLTCISGAHASENQLWTGISVTGPVNNSSKFLLWFDGHARSRNDTDDLGVTIIRPGIGWKASEKLSVWAGYARVVARSDTGPDAVDDRIWQQMTYTIGMMGNGKFSGRTRLEQRLRDTGDDTGWRVRQTLGYSVPLENKPNISMVLSNEIFWALNETDWGQRDGYDQNRALIGLRFKNSDKVNTTIGYLNNHLDRGSASSITNHNIALSVSVGL